MSVLYTEIFSEYDVTKWGIRFEEDSAATVMDTLASASESMEVRTVTKNKRNMPWKTRTKATGSGTVTVTAHIKNDIFAKMFGMIQTGYKAGAMIYGSGSTHNQFCMTELVVDEDGVKKLKAYPCCTIKEGLARSVETNGEEIPEISLNIAVDPDDDGVGLYEMVCGDEEDESFINQWITTFSASMVQESEDEDTEEDS